ncbi:MAG: LacI family transcriptional regulator [Solobacterium sp.]|nr:LacI family transcriptional regulator [Solobacterium sp.]
MKTIKDIARLSGYSIGTVSRVINNRPDVSAEARRKIEEVIARENFQPNSNAKLLKQRETSAITVIVKGINNNFLESILEEVQISLHMHGEDINVVFMDETENEIDTAIQICSTQKPKGIIFLGGNLKYFQEKFRLISIPCVLVTDTASGLGFDNLSSFATDDMEAAKEAIAYLIHKGHRKIGIVGGSISSEMGQVGSRRLEGALAELRRHKIPFDVRKDFVSCRFSMEEGYKAAKKLLEKKKDITGIFAVSDMIAIGVIRACADKGLKVPDDVSLIGFDGIDYTKYSNPRLATIQQDVRELAKRSVEDLLMRINYSRPAVHGMVMFRVITGESIKELKVSKQ